MSDIKITKDDFKIRKFDIPLPNTHCVDCLLYTKISNIKVSYWGEFGSEGIKYVFINNRGNSTDHMFFGVKELPLLQMIKELNMTDFFIMGLAICRPKDGKTEGNIQQSITCCRDNFDTIFQSIIQTNQLLGVPPPIAIVLGFEAMKGLFPDTKKNAKMKDVKNDVYSHSSYPGVKFFITYNQLIIDKSPDFYGTIKNDLLRIMTLDNPITVDNSNYKTISSIPEFDDLMDELAASEEFAFDIETSGLKYKPMYTVTQKKSKGLKTTTLEIEKSMLIGISFSCKEKSGYYIPLYIKFKHFDDNRTQFLEDYCNPQLSFDLPDDATLESFGFWFGEPYQDYIHQGLKKLLENNTPKIAHNGKFDVTFLQEWWGIKVKNFYYDTMLASYLSNENSPNSLEFQSDVNFPDLVGYKSIVYNRLRKDDIDEENYADIPLDIVSLYGGKDADATFRLRKVYDKQFDNEYTEYHSGRKKYPDAWVDSAQLLHKLYMPLSKRYGEAEMAGILFDKEYAEKTAIQFTEEMQAIQERIDFILKDASIPKLQEDDDRWINLNSPKQKKLLFFDLLGWPIQKETQSAKDARKYRRGDIIDPEDASTDQDSLKQILEIFYAERETADRELEVELIELILDYLKRNKMVSTYLRGPKLYSRLDPDNYLHYSMKLHGTVSGRLSSTPNVQNLPKKTSEIQLPTGRIKAAMNIRGIFIAPPNYKLASCDLSQAELRIMADYADDKRMLWYIEEGIDIHWTATLDIFYHSQKLIFNPKDPIMKRYRKLIKLLNFGGLYGGSDRKKVSSVNEKLELGEEKITMKLAQAHSEWFWSEFADTGRYLQLMENHILKYGYIDNKFGRRRRLPDSRSLDKMKRAAAVREGINAQIQGTASDIAQCGLLKIADYFEENNLKSKTMWSVHDEVDLYLHNAEIEMLTPIIPALMIEKSTKYLPLDIIKVKLDSELEIYKNRWGD